MSDPSKPWTLKTIALMAIVRVPKNIQWWWCPPEPLTIFNCLFKTIDIFNGLLKIIKQIQWSLKNRWNFHWSLQKTKIVGGPGISLCEIYLQKSDRPQKYKDLNSGWNHMYSVLIVIVANKKFPKLPFGGYQKKSWQFTSNFWD